MSSLKQAKEQKTLTFTAILHWEEDVYVAECPEVGTASQGETIEEAIANLKEATELYLELLTKKCAVHQTINIGVIDCAMQ